MIIDDHLSFPLITLITLVDRRGGGEGNEKGPGGKGSEIVLNLLIVNNHARDTHLSESCTNNIIILMIYYCVYLSIRGNFQTWNILCM